jgi:hypothetical protein
LKNLISPSFTRLGTLFNFALLFFYCNYVFINKNIVTIEKLVLKKTPPKKLYGIKPKLKNLKTPMNAAIFSQPGASFFSQTIHFNFTKIKQKPISMIGPANKLFPSILYRYFLLRRRLNSLFYQKMELVDHLYSQFFVMTLPRFFQKKYKFFFPPFFPKNLDIFITKFRSKIYILKKKNLYVNFGLTHK